VDQDLTELLRAWPFEAGKLNVRVVEGKDGNTKIQIRLDLGIIQLEADGRPDGLRPNGHESLLQFFEQRLSLGPGEDGVDDEQPDDAEPGALSSEDCQAIRDEAAQYYHRYVALLGVEEYLAVVRDTTRNLRALDLCLGYAEEEEDREALEPVRPYIIMIRARAMTGWLLGRGEQKAAIWAIESALAELRGVYERRGEPEGFEGSTEVQMLRSMRDALVPRLPVSQRAELRDRLREALDRENYELAAILRDELRLMGDDGQSRKHDA
jgi:hypothetical protein